MAHTVNIFKMFDGPSHVVLHCFLQSDGLSAELTNFVLLDPMVDLDPVMSHRQNLIVKQLWYEISGFTATFAFDAPTPWPFWTLTPGVDSSHDWRFFGGIRDHASAGTLGLDASGKLLISTQGLTAPTSCGAFVLWLEKRDRLDPQPN